MRKQDIENIELGHQQIPFGFENNMLKEQDLIMSCIKNQAEKHGYIVLDKFFQYVRKSHDLPDFTILQNVFWLAKDLKIHFRINGDILEPCKVKQILIKPHEQSIKIVTNKSVNNSVFQDVKNLYRKLSEGKSCNDFDDQYEFSRLLAKKIKVWIVILKPCQSAAQKPFFPFGKEIDDCMHFIKKISAKLDSFSLINAFYENKERILKLDDDVSIISKFYKEYLYFWENLTQTIEEFNDNLTELIKDRDIVASFEKLKQILTSSDSYNMIKELEILLNKLIQQCRIALSGKVDSMIVKMKEHLDAHDAGQDLRNKSLYYLRSIKKCIHEAKNIRSMSLCLIDAEEKFDAFWDEVQI
jgi:hypothetical protein